MRSKEEISALINTFNIEKLNTKTSRAILDVLRNNLTYEQIELRYFDESDVWTEQGAYRARRWLDGEIESNEFYV